MFFDHGAALPNAQTWMLVSVWVSAEVWVWVWTVRVSAKVWVCGCVVVGVWVLVVLVRCCTLVWGVGGGVKVFE
jgi:hypothetical protein